LEYLCVEERRLSEWIMEIEGEVLIGFIWLKVSTRGGLF
jgi:hypothetical protein